MVFFFFTDTCLPETEMCGCIKAAVTCSRRQREGGGSSVIHTPVFQQTPTEPQFSGKNPPPPSNCHSVQTSSDLHGQTQPDDLLTHYLKQHLVQQ